MFNVDIEANVTSLLLSPGPITPSQRQSYTLLYLDFDHRLASHVSLGEVDT
jgi:hypothetical protein